jgi:hypothetical protein
LPEHAILPCGDSDEPATAAYSIGGRVASSYQMNAGRCELSSRGGAADFAPVTLLDLSAFAEVSERVE